MEANSESERERSRASPAKRLVASAMGIVRSALRHYNAGVAILVKAPVFQTDKASSILVTRSNAPFVYRLGLRAFNA